MPCVGVLAEFDQKSEDIAKSRQAYLHTSFIILEASGLFAKHPEGFAALLTYGTFQSTSLFLA